MNNLHLDDSDEILSSALVSPDAETVELPEGTFAEAISKLIVDTLLEKSEKTTLFGIYFLYTFNTGVTSLKLEQDRVVNCYIHSDCRHEALEVLIAELQDYSTGYRNNIISFNDEGGSLTTRSYLEVASKDLVRVTIKEGIVKDVIYDDEIKDKVLMLQLHDDNIGTLTLEVHYE